MEIYQIFFTVVMTVLGLEFGSFLNVCIYRIPRGIFFEKARSFCPQCSTQLKWYDNIPLFSFIFLGGRCRFCKERISFRYPCVEALNCVLWLISALVFGISAYSVIIAVLSSILIVVAFVDYELMEIPYSSNIAITVLGALVLGLCFTSNSYILPDAVKIVWWERLIGLVVVSVPFFVLGFFTGGIGGGDVFLMAGLGLFLGYKLVLIGALFGVILAGIVGIILIFAFGKSKKAVMPLGPFLAFGSLLSCYVGNYVIEALFLV